VDTSSLDQARLVILSAKPADPRLTSASLITYRKLGRPTGIRCSGHANERAFPRYKISILVLSRCPPLSVFRTFPLCFWDVAGVGAQSPIIPNQGNIDINLEGKAYFNSFAVLFPDLIQWQTSVMGPANARKASNGLPEGEMIFHSSELTPLASSLSTSPGRLSRRQHERRNASI